MVHCTSFRSSVSAYLEALMVNGNTKIIYACSSFIKCLVVVYIVYILLVLPIERVAFNLAIGNFKKKVDKINPLSKFVSPLIFYIFGEDTTSVPGDHLPYNLGIISGPGIICGPIRGSFAVRGSFAGRDHLRASTARPCCSWNAGVNLSVGVNLREFHYKYFWILIFSKKLKEKVFYSSIRIPFRQ